MASSSKADSYHRRLNSFLENYRVKPKAEFTHTNINNGSYYIPDSEIDKFYQNYSKCVKHGVNELYLTEKHKENAPIVIDIDFKFTEEKTRRRYEESDILNLLNIYVTILDEYILDTEEYEIFVLEKKKPVKHKGQIKDGIHIVIPDIVTSCDFQYLLREKVLEKIKENNTFKHLETINTIDDIIDKAVIKRNNWQMYGSRKPNYDAYALTKLYLKTQEEKEIRITDLPVNKYSNNELPKILSIRNKELCNSYNKEYKDNIEAWINKNCRIKKRQVIEHSRSKSDNIPDYDLIKKLVELLSVERCDDFASWVEVGFCLHNLHDNLLPLWIEFSKKSKKYREGDCDQRWKGFREDGLGIGSLHYWAKTDNEEKYRETMRTVISHMIENSPTTHVDCAAILYKINQHEFVCVDQKKNVWYQFRNERWFKTEQGYTLRQKISSELVNEYASCISKMSQKLINAAEEEQEIISKKIDKINKAIISFKTSKFKNDVMRECAEFFFDPDFEEKLDTNIDLLGFDNGVYDLKNLVFRNGRPDDYISMSTHIDYVDHEDDDINLIRAVQDFIYQIHPKEDMREYVCSFLASCLHGSVPDEKFPIWTGTGSNGKSKLIELIQESLGDYATVLPTSLLTGKRNKSNTASPEIAQCKGVRFATFQEPEEGAKINVGLMKEYTGGDKISCRGLYKDQTTFKPMMKLVLVCNHLPGIPSDDGGTWRRIRGVEFKSKFTSKPDEKKENEFMIDTRLSEKMKEWKETFVSILIEQYKKYLKDGLIEPDEVLEFTKEYEKSNDTFLEFLEENIESNENSFVSLDNLYSIYKMWFKTSYSDGKCEPKKVLKDYMERKFGKLTKRKGWTGIEIIPVGGFEEDLID